MEAVSAFDWKRIERNQLRAELERQLAQIQRSRELSVAQQLAGQLIQANLTNAKLLNELFQRLDDFLVRVAARAEMIPLSAEIIHAMIRLQQETELDRDDALILASIIADSKKRPPKTRAFLTGNFHDFEVEPVRNILEQNQIKLFPSSGSVLRAAVTEQRRNAPE